MLKMAILNTNWNFGKISYIGYEHNPVSGTFLNLKNNEKVKSGNFVLLKVKHTKTYSTFVLAYKNKISRENIDGSSV